MKRLIRISTRTMLRIILIGYGEIAEALLRGILTTDHKVVGFLSWDRRKNLSRLSKLFFPDELEKLRRKARISALDVASVNSFEFISVASKLEPDIILIGSWGEILKNFAIEVPRKLCINCHPSYLPEHRGSNPYASAIVMGEEYTGVTFHEVDEGIDTGQIILQKKVPIDINDTGDSLRDKCAIAAEKMVPALLESIDNNSYTLTKQDEARASYYPRLKVTDGAIKWEQPAEKIHNIIRGLSPWIKAYVLYKANILLIGRSELVNIKETKLQSGTILEVMPDGVIVSTSTPGKGLFLNDLTIFGLSKAPSKILLKRMLVPGALFQNPL